MEKGNWEYKKIGTLSLCEFNPECPWGFEQKMTYALKRHIIYASSEETMEKSLEKVLLTLRTIRQRFLVNIQ